MNKTIKRKKQKNKSKRNRKQKGGNNEDDSNCKYVCSHGIMKSVHKLDNLYHYIKSDKLNEFIIPNEKFILVTGNEDTTIPDDFKEKSNEILKSPNLIHWHAQNLTKHDNPKLSAIPIGLDYHTIAEHKSGYEWWGEKETPVKQEQLIAKLNNKPFYERELKIYCNFLNSIRGKYGEKDRREALELIPDTLLIKEEKQIPRNKTWEHISNIAFVASPHGNGLDCHRTWEALVLGSIPIVKRSSLDSLYDNLPVLIVNDWIDITEQLLKNTIQLFKRKHFNYEKLTLQYWMKKIQNIEDLKNVVILTANKAYLDKAYNTINEIRTKGKWSGDIVFFYDKDLEGDSKLESMKEKYNILLKQFPNIDTSIVANSFKNVKNEKFGPLKNKLFQYFKFYVFDLYFKQWDRVLYIDSGMHIYKPIDRIFHLDTQNKLTAHSDSFPTFETKLNDQFMMNTNYGKQLKNNYNLNGDYFQSGMLYFDTSIIKDDTVNTLIELMNKYPVGFGDQAIMNLYFKQLWNPLAIKNNSGYTYNYKNRNAAKPEDYIMIKYPTGGNQKMKQYNVLFGGCIRNVEKDIEHNLQNLDRCGSKFNNYKVILFENDSIDKTREILNKNKKDNYIYIFEDNVKGSKTENIANARNKILDKVKELNVSNTYDFLIMIDLDDRNNSGKFVDTIETCFTNDDWDVLTGNQSDYYYDLWALRQKGYIDYDVWKNVKEEMSKGMSYDDYFNKYVVSKYKTFPPGDFLEVDSAFGGIAIYRLKSIPDNCKYIGKDTDGDDVCEHVNFNECIKKSGGKLYINTSFLTN